MSWLDKLQSPSDLLPTGEKDVPPLKPHEPSMNPMHFISHMDSLMEKMDKYISEMHQFRQRNFRSHTRTLQPGEYTTLNEDFVPDKWIIILPESVSSQIGAYPSSGRPVSPDMFIISASESVTLPGLSQYVSLTNLGPEVADVTIFSLVGYDLDYDPPSSGSLTNVSSGTRFYTITPNDVTAVTPIPRALYVGTGGNIVIRGSSDTADTTFLNVQSGTLLSISPKYIRNTNTTATNLVGIV